MAETKADIEKKLPAANYKLVCAKNAKKQISEPRNVRIIGAVLLVLVFPGLVVPSLVLAPVHDAVPGWYTGLMGWVIRIVLVILLVLYCWRVTNRYHESIADAQEKVDAAQIELDQLHAKIEKLS